MESTDQVVKANDASNAQPVRKIGEGPSQIFHDRARVSQIEFRKLLLSLGSGTLAVYFAILTAQDTDKLNHWEVRLALIALTLMSISVMSGLFLWKADTQRNYMLGAGLQTKNKDTQQLRSASYRTWEKIFTLLSRAQSLSFLLAIVASVMYSFFFFYVFQ